MTPASATPTLEELRERVESGEIHTVLLGFVDMQGRLQGKRCSGRYFVHEVADHGAGACDYLLSVDVEMNPQAGYDIAGWDKGHGDFTLNPDLSTLRVLAWREGTAVCFADAAWSDGTPVVQSPRQVLQRQLDRLAERGWTSNAATELEFIAHQETYEQAWNAGYVNLTPINRYNVDYSLFGLTQADPLITDICRALEDSGLFVETAKGEANYGQHEINLKYDEAMASADAHVLFKHAVKEIALRHDVSATFMAKWDNREGNSCHVHMSLQDQDGNAVFEQQPELFDHFVAGQLACLNEFTLFFAPNINSYKRFASRSFAPTAIAWGHDNRSCALRVLGKGPATRIENRVGGGDVNPYLVLAATIAAGLHGIDNQLALPPAEEHDAYSADHERIPLTLADAITSLRGSTTAREAFGDDVIEHYLHAAEIELAEFNSAITDWERKRGYERL
ncbi:glutamine synthetase family protein [Mycolicibacterium iranicum]|uniref:Glutamine synthetase n=1 Tax=Mycolicibacterium iranicum TaxID=912594 RepID=A0A1X1WPQ4_MYCIR|nr:glutamine synthetase family protein [Mycolicibacterium iranicum]ORV88591.1 glutamine synthetase [Mycolicibacterium iranicum]